MELAGVETERESCGQASRAREASTEGEGEPGRCSGEARYEGEDGVTEASAATTDGLAMMSTPLSLSRVLLRSLRLSDARQ
jgi:hypothetical protein